MTDPDEPQLRLIDGGARSEDRGGGGAGATLELVTEGWRPPALFLAARDVALEAALAWASVDDLGALAGLAVRHVVDLRRAPAIVAIRGRTLVELAADAGVTWSSLEALADVFVGESWHAEVYRHRLDRHFVDAHASVVQLRGLIAEGPVLALTDGGGAIYRDRLVRALERVAPLRHSVPP